MTPPVRKRVPPAKTQPQTRSDDIREFEAAQPAVEITREEGDEGYFPELAPGRMQEDERVTERSPRIPSPTKVRTRGVLDRMRESFRGTPKRGRSKAAKPRKSIETVIGGAWGFLGKIVGTADAPVGRMLVLQAPVAGRVLERRLQNTLIDKMLQPFAQAGEGADVAFALLGPPLLIAALERKPEFASTLLPALRHSLMRWIQIAGPVVTEMAQEEARFEEEYGMQIQAMLAFVLDGVLDVSTDGSLPTTSVPGSVPGMGHATANGRTDTPAGVFRTTDH